MTNADRLSRKTIEFNHGEMNGWGIDISTADPIFVGS